MKAGYVKYIIYLYDDETLKLIKDDVLYYMPYVMFKLRYFDLADELKNLKIRRGWFGEGWSFEMPARSLNDYIPEAPDVTFMVLSYFKPSLERGGIITWREKDILEAYKDGRIIDYRPNEERVREFKIYAMMYRRFQAVEQVLEEIFKTLGSTLRRVYFTDADNLEEFTREVISRLRTCLII